MGGQYLVQMSEGAAKTDGNRRVASDQTKRRKALKVKPTVRGGPKKRSTRKGGSVQR